MAKPETKAPAVSAPIKKADFGLQLINFITNVEIVNFIKYTSTYNNKKLN